MYNRIGKKLLCGITAVALTAGMGMSAIAAETNWGDIPPDGFTFEVEHSGNTYIFGATNQDSGSSSSRATETAQVDLKAYADEIFRLTNIERENAGLEPIERCKEMDAVATIRAKELSELFSHDRPNGEWYTSLADEASISYTYIGENGGTLPAKCGANSMIEGWMNSEGHRKNMLRTKHTHVGIGVYQEGQKLYCSLMLYY